MDPRITGRFPGATRPWSNSPRDQEEGDPHHHAETQETAAEKEICLNCTIPEEFCEGNCEGVAYSTRYEQQKKREALIRDLPLGLTAKELHEKHKYSVNTIQKYAKELGIKLPRTSKRESPRKAPQNRAHRSRRPSR